jgi:hypothetical protein
MNKMPSERAERSLVFGSLSGTPSTVTAAHRQPGMVLANSQ